MHLFNKLITNVSDTCYLISPAEKSKYFLGTQLEVWPDKIILKVCVLGLEKEGKGSKITFCCLYKPFLLHSQNNLKITVFKWSIFLGGDLCERQGKGGFGFEVLCKDFAKGHCVCGDARSPWRRAVAAGFPSRGDWLDSYRLVFLWNANSEDL